MTEENIEIPIEEMTDARKVRNALRELSKEETFRHRIKQGKLRNKFTGIGKGLSRDIKYQEGNFIYAHLIDGEEVFEEFGTFLAAYGQAFDDVLSDRATPLSISLDGDVVMTTEDILQQGFKDCRINAVRQEKHTKKVDKKIKEKKPGK